MKLQNKVLTTTFLTILTITPNIAQAETSTSTTENTCKTAGWVTDSTGITLYEEGNGVIDLTKNAPKGMPAELHKIGVKTLAYDILGGRSFKEKTSRGINGVEALKNINKSNPDCYIITMGTNDAANIAVGSNYSAQQRMEDVNKLTNNKPVYWMSPAMTTNAQVTGYSNKVADNFTNELKQYSKTHKNFTIIDSKKLMQDNVNKNNLPETFNDFFWEDGIHPKNGNVAKFRTQTVIDSMLNNEKQNYQTTE